MRLIMAVSADGIVAKGEDDTMDWLGPTDKKVFRILTSVGGPLGVSRKTAKVMPKTLKGRKLITISGSRGAPLVSLDTFRSYYGASGWLLGGQTLAMVALETNALDEVHLCRSERLAGKGHKDQITPFLNSPSTPYSKGTWVMEMKTAINDVSVEYWKFHR